MSVSPSTLNLAWSLKSTCHYWTTNIGFSHSLLYPSKSMCVLGPYDYQPWKFSRLIFLVGQWNVLSLLPSWKMYVFINQFQKEQSTIYITIGDIGTLGMWYGGGSSFSNMNMQVTYRENANLNVFMMSLVTFTWRSMDIVFTEGLLTLDLR